MLNKPIHRAKRDPTSNYLRPLRKVNKICKDFYYLVGQLDLIVCKFQRING